MKRISIYDGVSIDLVRNEVTMVKRLCCTRDEKVVDYFVDNAVEEVRSDIESGALTYTVSIMEK